MAAGAAATLYEEPDVLVKVVRDLFNEDFSGLIVSGDDAWSTINDYVNAVAPELMSKLTKYDVAGNSGPDVFALFTTTNRLKFVGPGKALDEQALRRPLAGRSVQSLIGGLIAPRGGLAPVQQAGVRHRRRDRRHWRRPVFDGAFVHEGEARKFRLNSWRKGG